MPESAIVLCATCGIPGRVVFEGSKIVAAYFVCKCPRPSVEKANERTSSMDQTFSEKDRRAVFSALTYINEDAVRALYLGCASENFVADFRAVVAEVYRPEAIERWEKAAL